MAGFDVQSSVTVRGASTFVSALVEGSPAQSPIALMPSRTQSACTGSWHIGSWHIGWIQTRSTM